MTLTEHYQPDVARKHAELTQQLHRTAWGDLWAQGIVFFSPELAFHWRSRRNELLTFWEPMGDASMCHDLRLELDDYRKQDDALRVTYERAQGQTYRTHLCTDVDSDGICQGGCDWRGEDADDLYDAWLDERYQEWEAQQGAVV